MKIQNAADRAELRTQHIADIIRTQGAFKHRQVAMKEVYLRSTLENVVALLEDCLKDSDVQVNIDVEAPQVIETDESGFQQMLVNLVSNAIDAVNERSAAAESDWTPQVQIRSYIDGTNLVIDVEDNGVGISPDKLRAIFNAGFTTKQGGTGLGLHSAATFVARTGGRIQAMSEGVGCGTTVQVSMRLVSLGIPQEQARETTTTSPRLPRVRTVEESAGD